MTTPALHQTRYCAILRTAAIAVLLASRIVMAQDPLDGLPADHAELGALTDPKDARHQAARIATSVARPVSADDLRRFATILQLSQEQRASVRESYLAYRTDVDELYGKHGPAVADHAYAAAEITGLYDWEYLRHINALRDEEEAFNKELLRRDDQFLASMQVILAEPQQPLFERVSLRRQRDRCQPHLVMSYHGRIDLVRLVEKTIHDLDVVADCDPMMLEYERSITPLHVELDQISRQIDRERNEIMVRWNYAADGVTKLPENSEVLFARQREFLPRFNELGRRLVPPQKRLAEINRICIQQLAERLPEPMAATVRAEYLQQAYPMVHPDRQSPADLVRQMLAVDKVEPDLRLLMQAKVDAYDAEYSRLTTEMETHLDAWNEHMVETLSSNEEHRQAVRTARLQRWDAGQRIVETLHGMLPVDAQGRFDKPVKAMIQQINSARTMQAQYRAANP